MTSKNQNPEEVVKVDGGLQASLLSALEALYEKVVTITDLTAALESESERLDHYIGTIAGEKLRVANTLLKVL